MAFCRARQKAESPQWIQLRSRLKSGRSCRLNKLFRLSGTLHRSSGGLTAGDGLCHFIKISGSDKPLVPNRRITFIRALEFFFLKPRIRRHAFTRVAMRELKHAVIQGVEAGQCYELELVSHGGKLSLELGDCRFVKFLLPME